MNRVEFSVENDSKKTFLTYASHYSPFLEEYYNVMHPFFLCHCISKPEEYVYIGECDSFRFSKGVSGYCISMNKDMYVRINCFAKLDFSQVILSGCGHKMTQIKFRIIDMLLLYCFRYRMLFLGGMCIHAAAIIYRNFGIVFCGPPGAGKSTQAILWEKYLGARILNHDKPAIARVKGIDTVFGTPWSGKNPVYINASAPLRAIIFICKAEINYLRRLSPAEAVSYMYPNFNLFPISQEINSLYLSTLEAWASRTPVYVLYCKVDEEAVQTVRNELFHEYKV